LLVYVVAFGLIAMYWTHHSVLFAGLQRADRRLVVVWLVERQWVHVLTLPETHKGPKTARLARRLVWASRFFALVLVSGVLVALLDVKAGIAVILVMPLLNFMNFVRVGKRPASDDAPADDTDLEAPS